MELAGPARQQMTAPPATEAVAPAPPAPHTFPPPLSTPFPKPWLPRGPINWAVDHLPTFWRLMNLGLVATLLVLYLLFAQVGGVVRPRIEVWLLISGFVAQIAIALSMRGAGAPWHPGSNWPVSTAVNLVVAVAVSFASPIGDILCAALMLPPVIVIAFRRPLWQAMGVGIVAGLATRVPPGFNFAVAHTVPASAVFNATVMGVSEVVVAIIVWLFASAVRADGERLRAAEARLAAEEKLAAVGRLAAGIAHEIRNPVAMIASSLELAAKESTSATVRAEMSQIARDESDRLTRLTNDFLAYARNRPLDLKEVPASGVCDAVAGLVRAHAIETGVDLRTECAPDLPINVDELQLHQAILNLVTNAIDATSAGGTVTIGARPAATAIGIDLFVANSAGPVPAQTADRLFEPFFTTKPTGTGLGLSIARSIAVAHGGDLRLTDNRPGRVCFTLHLPSPPPAPTDKGNT